MMLNDIKHWHRATVQKIAMRFGLPEDMSHHRRRPHVQRQAHVAKRNANRLADWQRQHNQRVGAWHARHAAAVMNGTGRLYKWERFVYKQVTRVGKMAK